MGVLVGKPWGASALYVLLIGWLGQMVHGHLHHIGVRLIATMARGDGDETRPGELLVPPLSWATFACFQAAVATGGLALPFGVPELLAGAALGGLLGWSAMVANVVIQAGLARQQHEP